MTKRECSSCGAPVEHSRKRQHYCRKCHADYMRQWRKTWTERTMKKIAAAIHKISKKEAA